MRRRPSPYTPKHLAHRILTSRTALEGEPKLVTVLFADMRGSMEQLATPGTILLGPSTLASCFTSSRARIAPRAG